MSLQQPKVKTGHVRAHIHTWVPLGICLHTIPGCSNTLLSKAMGAEDSLTSHPFCVSISTGIHCESYKDPCANVSCLNGGTCDSEGLNGTCVCTPGFTGKWPRNWVFKFTTKFLSLPLLKKKIRSLSAKGEWTLHLSIDEGLLKNNPLLVIKWGSSETSICT